jgi:hypothetical protein
MHSIRITIMIAFGVCTDQNPRRQDPSKLWSVQGALNLMPQPHGPQATGAFVCIPKSHLLFKQRFSVGLEREICMKDTHFLLLPSSHPLMAAAASGGKYAAIQASSMASMGDSSGETKAAAAPSTATPSTKTSSPSSSPSSSPTASPSSAKKERKPRRAKPGSKRAQMEAHAAKVSPGVDPLKEIAERASKAPYDSELCPIALSVDAGDFIIWDSCTIHANIAPLTGAPLPSTSAPNGAATPAIAEAVTNPPANDATLASQLRRLVAYVCMAPLSQVPLVKADGTADPRGSGSSNVDTLEPPTYESFITGRRLACQDAYSTSHWPTQWPIFDNGVGGRRAGATLKSTPRSCRKTTFTSQEMALLTGTPAPSSTTST